MSLLNKGGRLIFAIFDYCHLYKSIRNAFLVDQLFFNGILISIKCISVIHENDKIFCTKSLPKITDTHLHPNPFEKMSVSRAVQLFSWSVSSGIQQKLEENPGIFKGIQIETVQATADFCRKKKKRVKIY